MRTDPTTRTLPGRAPRPGSLARFRTVLLFTGALAAVAACGGGGGGGVVSPSPDGAPPGIQGVVFLGDADLGLVCGQEPNDARAQAYHLPPLGPRTRLEVTGEVGVTAARFGRADPVDAYRLETLTAQDVALTLDFPEDDPIGPDPNEVEVTVYDPSSDALLATTGTSGPIPRTTAFSMPAGREVDVVVTCTNGHAVYRVGFVCSNPVSAPSSSAAPQVRAPPPPSGGSVPSPQACAGGHLLVRLVPGADAAVFAGRHGLTVDGRTGGGSLRLRLAEPVREEKRAARIGAWCARLAEDPEVAWAEPDWMVRALGEPDDREYPRQWNLVAVGAPGAWDVTMGDPSVVVGVVDTGIVDHPDFEGQVVAGYDFISSPEISGDGDGRDDDPTDAGDRARSGGLSSWHGTNVAAIIAARANDGYGVTGLAPGCRVMPLRALGVGGGLVSDVADAILYGAGLLAPEDGDVLEAPLAVMNLSLGLSVDSTELREACERAAAAGVLLVAASGNEGVLGPLYPARYPTTVAVSAVDAKLDATGYSNIGTEIDICAPGGVASRDAAGDGWPDAVLSCVRDDTVYPAQTGFTYYEGTSQAAPHVAAAAALLLSVDDTLTAGDLKTLLLLTAYDRGPAGRDDVYGEGVVQAQEALRQLLDQNGAPRTDPSRLLLSSSSLSFQGLQSSHEIIVMNAGGMRLQLVGPTVATDDGAPWLNATNGLLQSGGPTNIRLMTVTVSRAVVPDTPATYTGTVFVRDATGPVGTIRVALHVERPQQAGLVATVVARTAVSGAVQTLGYAPATHGYRYWLRDLPGGSYKVMAGTDMDADGFFCEGTDACGWYGGATETQATVLSLPVLQTIRGVDVLLRQP